MILPRILCHVFVVFLLLSCSPAFAQDVASSPDALDDSGALLPTSGWLVGPAAINLPAGISTPVPCVMANQFDNGFLLRLSGGGNRLVALAIDFRQQVFTASQRYPLRIFVLPDYQGDFTATAYDSSTLILNLGGDEAIYRALTSAKAMDLSIGPTVARFDLTGLADGLGRLESCFRPPESPLPLQDVRSLRAVPVDSPPVSKFSNSRGSSSEAPPLPGLRSLSTNVQDPLNILDKQPPPLNLDEKAVFSEEKLNGFTPDAPSSMPQTSLPEDEEDVWRAMTGEDIQKVLARWSEKAGVSLVWTAKRGGRVGQDFRYQGSFDDAVQLFLAQAGKFQAERKEDATKTRLPEFRSSAGISKLNH